ncbi:hypothetical protein TWF281_004813 [Arthrobotrys megalospora]
MIDGWAENRLVDFDLWSAGAGVSAKGRLSFDERLILKPDIRDGIANLISLLTTFIDNCREKAREHDKSPNRVGNVEDGNANASTEDTRGRHISAEDGYNPLSLSEKKAKKDVEATLDQITRLTVAIRKAGSGARLLRADRSFDPQAATLRDLKGLLELVIHPRGFKTEDSPLTEIQKRLIEVNLRRRHRFLYAQQHSKRLRGSKYDSGETLIIERPEQNTGALPVTPENPSNRPESVNLKPDGAKSGILPSSSGILPTSTTAASAIEGTIIVPTPVIAPTPPTVISQIGSRVAYPRPPLIPESKTIFTCPCCYQTLPHSFTERSQWKKHLAGDIRPYTCTFPNCSRPFHTYLTRKEWEDHIKAEHFQIWRCFICSESGQTVEFQSKQDMQNHLQIEHQDTIEAREVTIFVDASYSMRQPENAGCPVCPVLQNDADLEHIARCVHDFSLRSLPLPSGTDQEDYFATDTGGSNSDDAGLSSTSETRDLDQLSDQSHEDSPTSDIGVAELTKSLLESLLQYFPSDTSSSTVQKYLGTLEFRVSVENINGNLDEETRRKILHWISPIDYTQRIDRVLSGSSKGVGKWFLDSEGFRRWLNGEEKTLFCTGAAGAGKSTIAATVADHIKTLRDLAQDPFDPKPGLAFLYYCGSETETQLPDNMLASLLAQLALSQPNVSNSIQESYAKHLNGEKPRLSHQEVLTELCIALKSYDQTFIVVDALDECQADYDCGTLLTDIYHLFNQFDIRLMLTSRGDVSPLLRDAHTEPGPVRGIHSQIPPTDLDQYIQDVISRPPSYFVRNSRLWELFGKIISDMARGM